MNVQTFPLSGFLSDCSCLSVIVSENKKKSKMVLFEAPQSVQKARFACHRCVAWINYKTMRTLSITPKRLYSKCPKLCVEHIAFILYIICSRNLITPVSKFMRNASVLFAHFGEPWFCQRSRWKFTKMLRFALSICFPCFLKDNFMDKTNRIDNHEITLFSYCLFAWGWTRLLADKNKATLLSV